MEYLRSDRQTLLTLSPEDRERATDVLSKMYMAHDLVMGNHSDIGNNDFVHIALLKDPLFLFLDRDLSDDFWNKFRAEIEKENPSLIIVINLLRLLKDGVHAVMARSTSLRREVDEILDIEMIEQQAQHGAFDMKYYGNYVISVLKKMCAPIRDRALDVLALETDPTRLLRGLFEVISLMKRDLISFELSAISPQVHSNQFEYERSKFYEYLGIVKVLPQTDKWLQKHTMEFSSVDEIVYNAFLTLVESTYPDIPETVAVDIERLKEIRYYFKWLTGACSLAIACIGCCPPVINRNKVLREKLKIMFGKVMRRAKTKKALFRDVFCITLAVTRTANDQLSALNLERMTVDEITILRRQVESVCDSNHSIRKIIRTRALDHMLKVMQSDSFSVPVPPALQIFMEEVNDLSLKFNLIVQHNLIICRGYYAERIRHFQSNP